MDIRSTLAHLDALFAAKDLAQVEPYLLQQLTQAEAESDKESKLTLFNELVGFYRSISRTEDSLKMAAQALLTVAELELGGTMACATTLINVATAYRAAGDLAHALPLYEDARLILQKEGVQGYALASLLNNMSQVYQTVGQHDEAISLLEQALSALAPLTGAEAEIATTHANMALSLMALHRHAEAREHVQSALEIFERGQGPHDAHYGAALAAAAELACLDGDLAEAVRLYEKALAETQQSFGKNDGYKTIARNLEKVRRALNKEVEI